MIELKQSIIAYVRDHYAQETKAPAVRKILQRFKGERMNFKRFYEIFPGGIEEACRLADVLPPVERLKQTSKAMEAVKEKERRSTLPTSPNNKLVLSEEQTRRVYGICQLEGGAEPSDVIDGLLDIDTKLRREYNLNQIGYLGKVLDEAHKMKWSPAEFVDYLTKYHNAIFLFLSYMRGEMTFETFRSRMEPYVRSL